MSDATQGNGAPEAPQGETGPKFVTEEQLNRAITARFGELSKKLEKSFGETFTKALDEKLSSFAPKGNEDESKPASPLEHPEVKGVLKQMQELQSRLKASEEREAAAKAKARDTQLRQQVGEALASAGIKDSMRAKHALKFLVDGEKLVAWDDESERLVFRDSDGFVDFNTGLKGWLKSEDAKMYLPPPDTSGAGGRTGQTPAVAAPRITPGAQPQSAPMNADQKAAMVAELLQRQGLGF